MTPFHAFGGDRIGVQKQATLGQARLSGNENKCAKRAYNIDLQA